MHLNNQIVHLIFRAKEKAARACISRNPLIVARITIVSKDIKHVAAATFGVLLNAVCEK